MIRDQDFAREGFGNWRVGEIGSIERLDCGQSRGSDRLVRLAFGKNEMPPRLGLGCQCNLTCKEL